MGLLLHIGKHTLIKCESAGNVAEFVQEWAQIRLMLEACYTIAGRKLLRLYVGVYMRHVFKKAMLYLGYNSKEYAGCTLHMGRKHRAM